MSSTPKGSIFDYAVSANFSIEFPCNNKRKLCIEEVENSSEFIDEALFKLKELVDESIEAREKGERIPLIFDIYDGDVFYEELPPHD